MPRLDPQLLPVVSLGALELSDLVNTKDDERLDGPLADAEAKARREPPAERAAVRAMYWQVGIDPTRRRPSSEALLRRVLRGERLPRINTLVDVCNWCSLEFQLPYGLYDSDRIDGNVSLRLGQPGEEYAGIGSKEVVHVGGRLVLVDDTGPFGNPTSDSRRTMVTVGTTRALAVIFAPRSLADLLEPALAATFERASAFTGARQAARFVV